MFAGQKKVSIICAVYNVEKYIRRSIDSIISQTYKNLEIILVDDGSTDRSGSICDEYMQKDSRIKVIHKSNGGVSSARQTGLNAATGDYVIHIDPDDYVDSDMIETLLEKALESNADMVSCDFYLDGKYHEQRYGSSQELLKGLIDVTIICVCWNVLVKRSFIVDHKIEFTPDWLCQSEDFLFFIRLLVVGATAEHIKKAFYHYSSNVGGSLTNKRSRKKVDSLVAVINEMEKIVNPADYDNFYNRKKYVLRAIYESRFLDMLSLYPEIHNRLLKEECNSSFSLALKGKYRQAYLCDFFSNVLRKFVQIKHKLYQ